MSSLYPCQIGDGLRVGLGGAALGNLFEPVSDEQVRQLLRAAWDDGCRSFDTAPHYGHGLSERRMGDALRHCPSDQRSLSSKVGRVLTPSASAPPEQHGYVHVLPFVQHWDYSAAGVRRSVFDTLQRLGMARLDVVYVHDMDADTHGEQAPEVFRQVIDEALPALRTLQGEGLVGAIGLGVNDHRVVQAVLDATDIDALLLAGRYTLLDHSALDLLRQCRSRGVAVALGGIFNSGLLAHGSGHAKATFNYAPAERSWVQRTARLEAVCAEYGVPLRAAALQFPAAHPAVGLLMLGARSVSEWRDALAMLRHPIPPAFWHALRRDSLLPTEAPVP